jgi:hypothetical protein
MQEAASRKYGSRLERRFGKPLPFFAQVTDKYLKSFGANITPPRKADHVPCFVYSSSGFAVLSDSETALTAAAGAFLSPWLSRRMAKASSIRILTSQLRNAPSYSKCGGLRDAACRQFSIATSALSSSPSTQRAMKFSNP